MIRSLYTAGWGMKANTMKMDVVSNNLSNINTAGYKRDSTVFESFESHLVRRVNDTKNMENPDNSIGEMQFGSAVGEIFTHFEIGNFQRTGNDFDLGIGLSENAFFAVEAKGEDGENVERLTRNGSFVVNEEGFLVNQNGNNILGENGPIEIIGDDITFNSDGTILNSNQIIGKLLMREVTDTKTLKKIGENLLETSDLTQYKDFTGEIKQGFIEQSNVNAIREMIEMVNMSKAYESNQKIVQQIDASLEKAVNEVGRI